MIKQLNKLKVTTIIGVAFFAIFSINSIVISQENLSNSSTTLVAAGTEITGNICFRGHLEIEGKVIGNIIAEAGQQAVVRVMAEGCVMGEIDVPTVVLNGKVVGNVYSSDNVLETDDSVKINRSLSTKKFENDTGYKAPSWRNLVTTMRNDFLANNSGIY